MIALIFLFHFIADFLFQSRKMGENKSKSNKWLLLHVGTYATILGILSFPLFNDWKIFIFWILINFCLHLSTDFCSSRLSSFFYRKKNMYRFWNIIGGDQTIHFITLYYTFTWLN